APRGRCSTDAARRRGAGAAGASPRWQACGAGRYDARVRILNFTLNGDAAEIAAPDHWTLLEVLRYRAGLTGSKQGCDKGDCGACTLHVDGRAVLSCLTLLADVEGRAVP